MKNQPKQELLENVLSSQFLKCTDLGYVLTYPVDSFCCSESPTELLQWKTMLLFDCGRIDKLVLSQRNMMLYQTSSEIR